MKLPRCPLTQKSAKSPCRAFCAAWTQVETRMCGSERSDSASEVRSWSLEAGTEVLTVVLTTLIKSRTR